MEPEHFGEWHRLEERAIELLHAGSAPNRVGVATLFRILERPAFDSAVGWEICRDVREGKRYFGVCTIWRRDVDEAKFANPVQRLQYPRELTPTIETCQLELEDAFAETAYERLKAMHAPVLLEVESVGCDGVFYELAFDLGFVRAQYGWWWKPPEPWHPLSDFVTQMLQDLDSRLRGETRSGS
jgi:hypothetical protein